MKPKRFFIIDAMAMAFRSFWALGRNPLSLPDGTPISAVYASAMFMNKLLNEEKPDYLAVVRESREPGFRTEMFKDYKANRDKMPDDLAKQMPHFWRMFEEYGYPAMSSPRMEADDVIGTMARKYASSDCHVYIVSGDKDFMQLISDQVFMYSPKKGEDAVIVDTQGVHGKFQTTPDRVIDCLALIGDAADNVPGVSGIGEKGAAKLIAEFGSLEGIYENIDKIKAKKQKENLVNQKDMAFLSRDLVTIKTDLPLEQSLQDFSCDWQETAFGQNIYNMYEEFGFKQLAARAKKHLGDDLVKATGQTEEKLEFVVADSRTVLTNLMSELIEAPQFGMCLDVEQEEDIFAAPKGVAFALSSTKSFYVPFEASNLKGMDAEEVRIAVKAVLEDPDQMKVSHSVKRDWHHLQNLNIRMAEPWVDTGVCDYLLDPNSSNHEFGHVLEKRLGRSLEENEDKIQSTGIKASAVFALWDSLEKEIAEADLTRVLFDIEMPLIKVLGDMERIGVYVDSDFLTSFSDKLATELAKVEADLYREAGEEFNVNSPKQLQGILFEKLKVHELLGIKRLKKTKTGFSTDESVLTQMSSHPVPRLILEFRELAKLKNTYVDTLPQHIHPKTGRLHTRLNQTVAATGRLSSDKPNLQNIPMRSALGKQIRKAFKPDNAEKCLVSADYSQVEIRLLAHMAQATHLIEAFRNGIDIHRATAAEVFGVKLEEVTDLMRGQAKAINFGIIYGMGATRLAAQTGVSVSEAKEFIEKYFAVYPGIKKFTEGLIEFARKHGYSVTMAGRKRPIPGIGDRNKAMLARAENIAVNAPIQGSAADIIKLAMIDVPRKFKQKKLKAKMLLQVHDELLVECPETESDLVKEVLRDSMENALQTSVPLTVEIRDGANWLEAH